MAVEALERASRDLPHVAKNQEPLRMDLIRLGRDVLTFVAEKHGLSYEEATTPRRSITRRTKLQGRILDEYMEAVMSVPLPLNQTENAIVMKSSPEGVTRRVKRMLRDSLGLQKLPKGLTF